MKNMIDRGYKSRSWLSWQIPIITNGAHKNSRINKVNIDKLNIRLELFFLKTPIINKDIIESDKNISGNIRFKSIFIYSLQYYLINLNYTCQLNY